MASFKYRDVTTWRQWKCAPSSGKSIFHVYIHYMYIYVRTLHYSDFTLAFSLFNLLLGHAIIWFELINGNFYKMNYFEVHVANLWICTWFWNCYQSFEICGSAKCKIIYDKLKKKQLRLAVTSYGNLRSQPSFYLTLFQFRGRYHVLFKISHFTTCVNSINIFIRSPCLLFHIIQACEFIILGHVFHVTLYQNSWTLLRRTSQIWVWNRPMNTIL